MNGRYVVVAVQPTALSIVENLEEDPGLLETTVTLSPPVSLLLVSYTTPNHLPRALSCARTHGSAKPIGSGPCPVRSTSTDLFGSADGSMRSVWDRVSSGTGAALSAVQDAYGSARGAANSDRAEY
jgi:hypothetical protein